MRSVMHEQLNLKGLLYHLGKCDHSKPVYYDFGRLFPTDFDSYRGYYEQLALGVSNGAHQHTAGTLFKAAKQCMGKIFTGYKGGDFLMTATTPIWVDNVGDCTGTFLYGVYESSGTVFLLTAKDMD
jgi:hypothetical protein